MLMQIQQTLGQVVGQMKEVQSSLATISRKVQRHDEILNSRGPVGPLTKAAGGLKTGVLNALTPNLRPCTFAWGGEGAGIRPEYSFDTLGSNF
jgi:hypothetical protein